MRKTFLRSRRKGLKANLRRLCDTAWSELIRKRDPMCRWCEKRVSNQAHHIFGRRASNTRWDPENGLGICAGCHMHGHEWPLDFNEHIRTNVLGTEAYDSLRLRAGLVMKMNSDYQMVLVALQLEAHRLGITLNSIGGKKLL